MIGLGSNRLTVCRRGGMSVTQAGRGGMEWLAGFRAPSWSTPYSAQATAYLQQHYSAYWSEIMAYGLDPAHQALIPYINEDPDLVCSLMELGKIRWLVGDGNSWIDTEVKPNESLVINTKVYYTYGTTSQYVYGGRNGFGNAMYGLNMADNNGNDMLFIYGSRFPYISPTYFKDVITTIYQDGGNITLESSLGTASSSQSSGTFQTNYNLCLFACNNAGSMLGTCTNIKMSYFVIGDNTKQFVPFVSTARNGMLDIHDLEHPVFHENKGSGTFGTEISETPAP